MELMALDNPRKSPPLADADHIHELPRLKEVESHLLAELIFLNALQAKFFQVVGRLCIGFLEMSGERLVHPFTVLWKETELKGAIAIFLLGLFLDHLTGPGLDHRHRYDRTILEKELGHP